MTVCCSLRDNDHMFWDNLCCWGGVQIVYFVRDGGWGNKMLFRGLLEAIQKCKHQYNPHQKCYRTKQYKFVEGNRLR